MLKQVFNVYEVCLSVQYALKAKPPHSDDTVVLWSHGGQRVTHSTRMFSNWLLAALSIFEEPFLSH